MASAAPFILRTDTEGVATLTMNRPASRNALTRSGIRDMTSALDAIKRDAAIKVVVLAGGGPAFCAGHDLKELRANPDPEWTRDLFDSCSAVMLAMIRLPQPIIARVHGIATAAGCQLVATADLAVASTTATFATPGVNIGLFCSTPMVALARNIGRKKAMEMLLIGRPLSAADAATAGLINMAVAPDKLDETVYGLATAISEKSSKILAIGKRAFYEQIELGLSDSYAYAGAVMARNLLEDDATEGIDAFLGKRKPVWAK
ncbi:MAG: enoyl-CoA hydratase [Rhodospirillaceae bacterium]|nr:enoyl-CoA hydratase [Rhodospirillaceae bacterium]